MTCIVGIAMNGHVIMGGDSAGISGLDLTVRSDEKVFRRGPFLMGFTSSFRMGQLLRYKLEVPEHPKGMADLEYMTILFVDSVRECLESGGWKKKKDEREEGGTFLVGYNGQVYEVHDDFQLAWPVNGYSACGCGAQVALGAIYGIQFAGYGPRAMVQVALEAAEEFNAGVRGPFVILSSEEDEVGVAK